jgi:hypothetical protein
VEGVDIAQAKNWRQEELELQSRVKALQGRLDERPSELDIMEKVATMMTNASANSLSGALPFVQALTGTGTLAPAHVTIGNSSHSNNTSHSNNCSSSSNNRSPVVRMQQVENWLGLEPASNAGLVPRIEAAEVFLFGPEGGAGGNVVKRLAALESQAGN